jgi:chemotaxis signal transduction protein
VTPGGAHLHDTAAALRESFDRAFAQPASTESAAVDNLLAIGIGADSYVLRLSEAAGLFVDKKITRLPTAVPELLGLAGFRGTVVPVYDLGMLLGSARSVAPRWLVVTAAMQAAVAFERFEGYLSVRREEIVAAVGQGGRERHVRDVVQAADLVRPVISLTSVLDWIQHRASRDGGEKE